MKKVVLVLAIFVLCVIMVAPCFGEMCPMTNVSIFTNKYHPYGDPIDGSIIITVADTGAGTVVGSDDYHNYFNLFFDSGTFSEIEEIEKKYRSRITIFFIGDPDQAFDNLSRHGEVRVDDVVCPSVIGEKIIQAKGYKDLKSTVIGQIPMYRIVVPNENYTIRNTFKQTHASFEKN
jgi:hypothetical protein